MNVMSDSVPAVASRPSPNPSPSLAVRCEAEALFVGPTHDTKRGPLEVNKCHNNNKLGL